MALIRHISRPWPPYASRCRTPHVANSLLHTRPEMRAYSFSPFVGALSFLEPAFALQSSDYWIDALDTFPAYKDASACAKTCIKNANTHTKSPCQSYGCVCSENDSRGTNLLDSYAGISTCVEKDCGGASLLVEASNVFKVICAAAVNNATGLTSTSITAPSPTTVTTLLAVSGSTKTVTSVAVPSQGPAVAIPVPTGTCASYTFNRPPSFDDLPGCSQFVFSGCLDGYGNPDKSDASCGPTERPAGWETYKGIKQFMGACEAYYVCAGPFFYLTLNQLFNQSAVFCRYKPSVNGSVDVEWDKVIGVMADFCTRANFPQGVYKYSFAGPADSVGKLGENSGSGLGKGEIIGIAVGAVAIVVTVLVSAPATWATVRTWKMTNEMLKARGSMPINVFPPAAQVITPTRPQMAGARGLQVP
ncbi:hypothetical protein B0T18DRAFT_404937 [Schizothecium vesticola]|uniref:Uncharacterized protein n=1 Tax=Schizothecium vesticola TaxID=314040 RepID=A0AA40KAX0_9PEZI|nr:hypothetical protein B0T18DRAFT_404937 [Schizothecium vesticola]